MSEPSHVVHVGPRDGSAADPRAGEKRDVEYRVRDGDGGWRWLATGFTPGDPPADGTGRRENGDSRRDDGRTPSARRSVAGVHNR